MSRFYVGQRVRIVRSIDNPEFVGQVTTITRDLHISWSITRGEYYEAYGVAIHPRFGPRPDALEPATDSYDKIEWSECIWKPDHVRDSA